ncbi:PH domain-containing protein [Candidatus Giovannonibacteria bacterium]|nr:PH domain-containing protein [Candidatus Giovannonibacteria bacterium]
MLNLEPAEKILIVLHHHWIAILGPALLVIFLALLPLIALPFLTGIPDASIVTPLYLLLSLLWWLLVLMLGFIFWVDYYLDVLIITSLRIINVDQDGLFRREFAEFKLDKVQDVSIEIPGFVATFFGYGDVIIQTASESNFTIKEVPRVYEAKNLILKHSGAASAKTVQGFGHPGE